MTKPTLKRILLKLSGEALNGGNPEVTFDPQILQFFCQQLMLLRSAGLEVAVVLGGGNIFRGARMVMEGVSRVSGDYMGMLATIINAVALQDVLGSYGVESEVYTPFEMPAFARRFNSAQVLAGLRHGRPAILAGGTGNPFFTTDSAAALRASEIEAEVLFKATKVDGVYAEDPVKNPGARRYDRLTYQEVLEQGLKVMDQTAIALCQEVGMPIRVFKFDDPENFHRIARGDGRVGTLISGPER